MVGLAMTSSTKHLERAMMFDFIKKMFGEGHIYADIVCEDGSTGRLRAPYIGDPATFNKAEYTAHVKAEVWFKHGKRVTEVNNIRLA